MIPGAMFASTSRLISAGSSWSNTKSVKYAGTVTADAGRTTFGQPADWAKTLDSQEFTVTFWFKRNGRDGAIIGSRNSSNAYWYTAVSGGAIVSYYGNNFASGGSISDATWYAVTQTVRNEGGTYTGRTYVGNSSTSVCNNSASTATQAIDWYWNIRRGSTNADFLSGSWGAYNIDNVAYWDVGFTGTEHVEWYNSGVAMDATTHSQAANLISYYYCGDHASDSTTNLQDTIGSNHGTHEQTSNVSYPSDVA